jgi:hypothetical protein
MRHRNFVALLAAVPLRQGLSSSPGDAAKYFLEPLLGKRLPDSIRF